MSERDVAVAAVETVRERIDRADLDRRIQTIQSRLSATFRQMGLSPADARAIASQVRDEIEAIFADSDR